MEGLCSAPACGRFVSFTVHGAGLIGGWWWQSAGLALTCTHEGHCYGPTLPVCGSSCFSPPVLVTVCRWAPLGTGVSSFHVCVAADEDVGSLDRGKVTRSPWGHVYRRLSHLSTSSSTRFLHHLEGARDCRGAGEGVGEVGGEGGSLPWRPTCKATVGLACLPKATPGVPVVLDGKAVGSFHTWHHRELLCWADPRPPGLCCVGFSGGSSTPWPISPLCHGKWPKRLPLSQGWRSRHGTCEDGACSIWRLS